MASHGTPRTAGALRERTAETRAEELERIGKYRQLVDLVKEKVNVKEYTPELLQKTTELLKENPEYYTIWNYRRRIYTSEFQSLSASTAAGETSEADKTSQVLDIIQLDLQFLFPLLLKFPKCYWIWNHRLWLLDQSTVYLPLQQSRRLWEEELVLVGKMLTRDSRNYHGWGYRRTVVKNLESPELSGESMARKEYEYTTKMIRNNLSNFSAWHNRSKVILQTLTEMRATDAERQKMLDEELALIHKALFDPYDQSLWFYHQNLMCTLDPALCQETMAPNLGKEQQLEYLDSELVFLEEVLEDANDCKWVYQASIDCLLMKGRLQEALSEPARTSIRVWLEKLKQLDPLRKGRWADMETSLDGA